LQNIFNATGIFVDTFLRQDVPKQKRTVRPSQGVHLVVDRSFLGGDTAIMIPRTSDGRVLFGVPWHGKVILGTTDTPVNGFLLEPRALEEEVNFILNTAGEYLVKKPARQDVLSVFAGLRPLTAPDSEADKTKTKEISRNHRIVVSKSGLVTITGGKWTTYRQMAEDAVNRAIATAGLPSRKCITRGIVLHGAQTPTDHTDFSYVYGTDAANILRLYEENPSWGGKIHPAYEYTAAQVVWAVRREMAQTLEDVLARRLRLLFLDARAAMECAPRVADIMASEMKKDSAWIESQVKAFTETGKNYILVP
jgi:glycerol-3-phosphate dehydrogenase